MNVLTKRGSLDNVVTYEHFCDAKKDLANIPKDQISLGSVAVVLKDENDALGIYIANSKKEWIEMSTSTGGGGSDPAASVDLIHICSSEDYDSVTGIPTIQEPEENKLYFVPNNGDSNNLFDEWIYVNGAWEKFGSAGSVIPGSNVNADWFQNNSAAGDYIKNRVGGYYKTSANLSLVYTGNVNYTTSSSNGSITYIFNNILISNLLINTTDFMSWLDKSCLIIDINGKRHYLNSQYQVDSNTYEIFEEFPITNSIANITYHISQDSSYLTLMLTASSNLFTEAPEIKIYSDPNPIVKIPKIFLDLPDMYGQNVGCIILNSPNTNQITKSNGSTNYYSLAANYNTTASDRCASAFGTGTIASADSSFAEGMNTVSGGQGSHAEGDSTKAMGWGSHVGGQGTIANGLAQIAIGTYNIEEQVNNYARKGNYIEIVGNGNDENSRSNARTLDWSGNEWLAGNLTAAGGSLTLGATTITEAQLQSLISITSASGVSF